MFGADWDVDIVILAGWIGRPVTFPSDEGLQLSTPSLYPPPFS